MRKRTNRKSIWLSAGSDRKWVRRPSDGKKIYCGAAVGTCIQGGGTGLNKPIFFTGIEHEHLPEEALLLVLLNDMLKTNCNDSGYDITVAVHGARDSEFISIFETPEAREYALRGELRNVDNQIYQPSALLVKNKELLESIFGHIAAHDIRIEAIVTPNGERARATQLINNRISEMLHSRG